jgi:hypothetical protein
MGGGGNHERRRGRERGGCGVKTGAILSTLSLVLVLMPKFVGSALPADMATGLPFPRPAPHLLHSTRAPGPARWVALRGGSHDDDSSGSDRSDDEEVVKSVKRTLKRFNPEEVKAATEYVSKSLRSAAAASGNRCNISIGSGNVEVRFGEPDKDPDEQAQVVMDEEGGDGSRIDSPIERIRRELRSRMEEEDGLSRRFFDALLQRNVSACYSLLEQGADPNWRSPVHHLNTVLHKVAAAGEVDMVGFLIDNGASVHATNLFGDTPLMASAGGAGLEPVSGIAKDEWSAAWRGGEKRSPEVEKWGGDLLRVCKVLLDAGADVQHANNYSNTPLHKAAANGFHRNVELLVRGGALVNWPNVDGATPLHFAAFGGHLRTCMVLMESGADVNAQDAEGNTALWEARLLKRVKVG